MNEITHKQAKRLMRAELDGLITDSQRHSLDAHLGGCDRCRAEAEALLKLAARLQSEFHHRWDVQHGPAPHVMTNIQSQIQRIMISNQINVGLRTLTGSAALIMLGLILIYFVSELRNASVASNGTAISGDATLANNPSLIAFVSAETGDEEIFTVKSDGTDLKNLTNNPAKDIDPVWSPDGTRIAFVSNRDGNEDIYVMNFDGSNVTRLTDDSASDTKPIWSPDGKKISYTSGDFNNNTNIHVMDSNGQNRRHVTNYVPNTIVWPDSWSSDNQFIFFNVYRQIFQVDIDSGDVTPITPETDKDVPLNFVSSKDNSTVSYLTQCNESNGSFCYILRSIHRDGTHQETLATFQTSELCINKPTANWNGAYIKWSPDQTKILFALTCEESGWLYIANADGSDFKPLTNYPILGNMPDYEVVTADWSQDSQSIVFVSALDNPGNLYILKINDALKNPSTGPTIITKSTTLVSSPSWQPTMNYDIVEQRQTPEPTTLPPYSNLIAFTSERDGNAEIYTMYPDGSNLMNLTNYSAHDVNPIWSPNGKHIAFESDRTGFIQIYTMNPDGSNLTQITNEETDHALGTKYGNTPDPWSPDGKKIIFSQTVRGDANNMLYVMDVDGSNKIALAGEPGLYTFLGWSPDGQKIVYQIPNFGHNAESRITIANVDGSGTMDGIVGKDFGISSQIQWESSDQLVLLAYNSNVEPPNWQLSRMYLTTDTSVYNGFGPTIADSNVPIVALFENTYVAEDQDALRWFAFNGSPIPTSPWNFPTVCEKPVSDPFMPDTFHTVSPDRNYAIVVVFCREGALFYLENADGTQINQLGTPIPGQSQVNELTWSPDGKHVIVSTSTEISTNLFRFDVQEMLNDPSAKPVQLTTDDAWKYGVVWQPILNNEVVEEKPIPESLSFTLIAAEAQTLAGFDILEPTYLPAGYMLDGVAYDASTQKVAMRFVSQNGDQGMLFIYQQRGDLLHDPAVSGYVIPVPVGDGEGEYIQGAWIYESPDTTTPTWDPRADSYSLTWQNGEFVFSINFIGGETITPLSLNELVEIAESLK